ncbi:MAG: GNAT family N-acetyltransferase [Polyangiaceae bacterium]|nr:GNAT family N-acetyltransferase [Polyangiaceae bacterium]
MTDDNKLSIVPAQLRDTGEYSSFIVQHMAESGQNGSPVFAPGHKPSREDVRDHAALRWSKKLTEPAWGRAFLLVNKTHNIFGHIELRGGRLISELHRASLGMGILRSHVGRGYGTRLLEYALFWARSQPQLAWVDLGVFEGNEPAFRLYKRAGFVVEYTRQDAFRLANGRSVNDIWMTLQLR